MVRAEQLRKEKDRESSQEMRVIMKQNNKVIYDSFGDNNNQNFFIFHVAATPIAALLFLLGIISGVCAIGLVSYGTRLMIRRLS